MSARVVHFEFPSTNTAASRKFYEAVFDWKIEPYPGPDEYLLVTTGERGTPGIDGAIGGPANDVHGTVNTISVDDIDDALRKVLANGGQIVHAKAEVPQVGLLAYVREPGGNFFGIIQMYPNGMM